MCKLTTFCSPHLSPLTESVLELAVISSHTSVVAGETAVLVCVGFGEPDVNITWSRDDQVISNSSLVSIYEEDLTRGDRLFKQSFLQLCSLQMSDSGTYTCTVSNGKASITSTTELSVGECVNWRTLIAIVCVCAFECLYISVVCSANSLHNFSCNI